VEQILDSIQLYKKNTTTLAPITTNSTKLRKTKYEEYTRKNPLQNDTN
jgi:hypothetical protein